MNISGNVNVLKPNHFAIFKSIDTLVLRQDSEGSVPYDWNAHGFDGVQVKRLEVSNLLGMIPLPAALKTLVDSLQELRIHSPDDAASLEKDTFRDLYKLQTLVIDQVRIENITDQAFSGLEHYLHTLRLTSAGLTAVPSAALVNLEHLTTLDLSRNKLDTLEKDALQNVTSLVKIYFDGNPLLKMEDDAFRGLSNLRYVSLASSDLEKVDPKVGELLTEYPDVQLDITHNDHLLCANLKWMAKLVKCTDSIIADETTRCYDHSYLPLREYLEEEVSVTCDVTTASINGTTFN